jgi:hypothetical protein
VGLEEHTIKKEKKSREFNGVATIGWTMYAACTPSMGAS